MRLWTIQSKDAFNKMQKTGLLRADEEHLLFDGDLKDSYLWMSDQMSKRIGPPPSGVRFPVWAWYQWEGIRKRPDMRHHCRGSNKEEEIVLLTIEVPDDQVLLSDFDYWHFVLNDCEMIYLTLTKNTLRKRRKRAGSRFSITNAHLKGKNIMTYLRKLRCGRSKRNG